MLSSTRRVIGFPRESTPGDRRTLLTPAVAALLREAGFEVVTEAGVSAGVFGADDDLAVAGVRFAEPGEVWGAPLVLRYKNTDPDEVARLRPDQTIGALFHAEGDPALLSALISSGVTAYSYEFITENNGFPLAAPGGEIAGVQAVLHGALALQTVHNGRGVLLAKVNGAMAPRVVVIGCGHVGSAAASTAAALGAHVTVLARSEHSASRYRTTAPQSVRVAVNNDETRQKALADADLVIGAILVSTFDTPPMITEPDLAVMKTGAVIVDATCGYGEGYLPTAGSVQTPGDRPRVVAGVLHLKVDVLPALVPVTTTEAYTATAAPYLVRLARVALQDVTDPAIEAARIAQRGALVHPVALHHASIYGVPA